LLQSQFFAECEKQAANASAICKYIREANMSTRLPALTAGERTAGIHADKWLIGPAFLFVFVVTKLPSEVGIDLA
jgi:hypothetical protein